MGPGSKFQHGRGIAVKFFVHEDFRAVGVGRNGNSADGIKWRGQRSIGARIPGGIYTFSGARAACLGSESPLHKRRGMGIKTAENFEKVGGAEGKADAGHIFLDELLRVDADDFAVRVEQRTAAISRIDGRIGLNPSARAGARELSDGADDALSDTEKHGIASVADRENTLPLANGRGVGEREMREFTFL